MNLSVRERGNLLFVVHNVYTVWRFVGNFNDENWCALAARLDLSYKQLWVIATTYVLHLSEQQGCTILCIPKKGGGNHIQSVAGVLVHTDQLWQARLLTVAMTTHGCHGHTPVSKSGEEFVGVPVSVVDPGPHLDSHRAAGHRCHPLHYPLKPCPSLHQ